MEDFKENTYYEMKGDIFKKVNNHLLCLTPRARNIDRRLFPFEFKESDFTILEMHQAKERINKAYMSYSEEWLHDGKRYKVFPNDIMLHDKPRKTAYFFSYDKKNTYSIIGDIVYHNGKVFFASFGYYPRVELYNFTTNSENKIIIGKLAKWCSYKRIKNIYEFKNNEWVCA